MKEKEEETQSISRKMKQKATNGNLFTEPKKDLEGSTTFPPTKVPIRRRGRPYGKAVLAHSTTTGTRHTPAYGILGRGGGRGAF